MKTSTTLLIGILGAACQNTPKTDELNEREVAKSESPRAAIVKTESLIATSAPVIPAQAQQLAPASVKVENVGSVRIAPELQKAVTRAMSIADANADGAITRDEAVGALNFVVGGFFFRADADADGKITPNERKTARIEFAKEHPEVEGLLTSFSQSAAVKALMRSLDANLDQTIELKQTRATIRDAVDGIFKAVDKDNNGIISAQEADNGFNVAAGALGRSAFTAADANSDGKMTLSEFKSSLEAPLKRAFEAVDANNDSQLTAEEAARMMWWLSERVDVAAERGYDAVSKAVGTPAANR
jgi:Ca2+-binding EF-hand superfamily protein